MTPKREKEFLDALEELEREEILKSANHFRLEFVAKALEGCVPMIMAHPRVMDEGHKAIEEITHDYAYCAHMLAKQVIDMQGRIQAAERAWDEEDPGNAAG